VLGLVRTSVANLSDNPLVPGGAEFIVARLTATDGLRPGLTTERAVAAALVPMDLATPHARPRARLDAR
jgi:hypothetical protein